MGESPEPKLGKTLVYAGCTAMIIILFVIGLCCIFFKEREKRNEQPNAREVYILKDEVVDIGVIQLENEKYLQ